MAPLIQSLSQLAVIGLALMPSGSFTIPDYVPNANIVQVQALPSVASNDQAPAKVPLRLMPLGASITFGFRSTDGNGYRQDLRDMLIDDGFKVDMVGSHKGGNMTDPDNEGWSGFRVDQVKGKAVKSVPKLQPNLFTINAGTNDCAQNHKLDTVGKRMDDLLEYLWDTSDDSTIILSTLIINLNSTIEERVQKVNSQYKALAKKKVAEGKKIILAEMHGDDGPNSKEMADNTHPNDVGYNKMAKIWYRAIKGAEAKGFLTKPNPMGSH